MASIREQILARMAAAITGATPAGTNVFRSREISITRTISPAIVVLPGEEESEAFGQATDRNELVAKVEIFVRGDVWDNLADAVAEPAHRVIKADAQLAALCTRIRKQRSTWEAEEADRTAGLLTMLYHIQYLSSASDIAALPAP